MAYVSTVVSGAVCLGVLIGLVSGIFFLVLAAVRWVSRERSSLREDERKRRKRLLVDSACQLGSPETRRAENGCGSRFRATAREEGRSSDVHAEQRVHSGACAEAAREGERLSVAEGQGPGSDTVRVREVMEKMVEALIGGPLDGTTVGQLSTHSAYLDMFTKYHNLLGRELARLGFALHLSIACKNEVSTIKKHSDLNRLIKEIVDQAMTLPDFKQVSPQPPKAARDFAAGDFVGKSYEDILATAILNKVIENFQGNGRENGDFAAGNPKPRARHRKSKRSEGNDALRSDGDWSDTSRSDQLSLTIEEYIEEVTTAVEVSEDDDSEPSALEMSASRRVPFPESGRTVVDGTDGENSDVEEQSTATELVTSTSSWEENWLFQKKRLRSTPNAHHPVPVPMLVPNPSEDFRALVGGVDADDLSDMSECSDSLLEELVTAPLQPEELPETDFEVPHYSIVSVSSSEEEIEGSGREKVKVILTHITEESFYEKLGEREVRDVTKSTAQVEKNPDRPETEPTVCAEEMPPESPPRRRRQPATPERPSSPELASLSDRDPTTPPTTPSNPTTDGGEDDPMRCRVAEREREKWTNPVPLAENPYSPESIEKRAQRRKRNEHLRAGTSTGESVDFPDESAESDEPPKIKAEKPFFTRDYYVNASKHPSGASSPTSEEVINLCRDAEREALSSRRRSGLHAVVRCRRCGRTGPDLETGQGVEGGVPPRGPREGELRLPSVKELARQFAAEERSGAERRRDGRRRAAEAAREAEVDYSTVPVSEIVVALQRAAGPGRGSGSGGEGGGRLGGKQVHSLTARSISREFREGLKGGSWRPGAERAGSGGESERGDVVCCRGKLSPTPSVDLKNVKKFWEEIITANSNSTKQK